MTVVSSILKLEKTGARVWTGIFLLGPVLSRPAAPSFSLFLSLPHGAFPNFSPDLVVAAAAKAPSVRARSFSSCLRFYTERFALRGSGLSAEGSELAKLGGGSSQPIQTNENLSKMRQKTSEVDPSLDEQDERGLLARARARDSA